MAPRLSTKSEMMKALTRWDQSTQIAALHQGLRELFSRSPAQWPERQEEPLAAAAWAPLIDISEDEHEYRIKAGFLPGRNQDAPVSAEVLDGMLTVHLAKKEKAKPQPEQVVDEITAWWQKALGSKAVLGQTSTRPAPDLGTPPRYFTWKKTEGTPVPPEKYIASAVPDSTTMEGSTDGGIPDQKGHPGLGSGSIALAQLKHWAGAIMTGAAVILAIGFMRLAGAVFLTFRAVLQKIRAPQGVSGNQSVRGD